jgi:hypothetical protein
MDPATSSFPPQWSNDGRRRSRSPEQHYHHRSQYASHHHRPVDSYHAGHVGMSSRYVQHNEEHAPLSRWSSTSTTNNNYMSSYPGEQHHHHQQTLNESEIGYSVVTELYHIPPHPQQQHSFDEHDTAMVSIPFVFSLFHFLCSFLIDFEDCAECSLLSLPSPERTRVGRPSPGSPPPTATIIIHTLGS